MREALPRIVAVMPVLGEHEVFWSNAARPDATDTARTHFDRLSLRRSLAYHDGVRLIRERQEEDIRRREACKEPKPGGCEST
jgi:hypothetical protein